MVEFLNNTFGIGNEISIPIIISIIVFISGGISSVILRNLITYSTRLQNRKTYRNILKEIVPKCNRTSTHTKLFYDTLKIENNDNRPLINQRITYLELAFQLDFKSIYSSFHRLFLIKCNKQLRTKAFNKTWSILENLKFYEERKILDYEAFGKQFQMHETNYYNQLEELRRQNDKLFQPYIGKKISINDFPESEFNYIKKRNTLYSDWASTDESIRRNKNVLYKKLVKPLLELNNRYNTLELTLESNTVLLAAEHEYEQINNLLLVNAQIFYSYSKYYRASSKVLEKCLKII